MSLDDFHSLLKYKYRYIQKTNTDKIEVIFKVGRKLTRLGASGANEADTRVGRWFG